jgi:acyl carrier protein
MVESALEQTVDELVARAAPAKAAGLTLGPDVNLRRDLGLDSLGLVTLIFSVAEALGKDPDDLVEMLTERSINTVGDLVSLARDIVSGAQGT